MPNQLRQVREARGWSSTRLRLALAQAAAQLDLVTASDASLRVMIS